MHTRQEVLERRAGMLRFIAGFQMRYGEAPNSVIIANQFGITRQRVYQILRELRQTNYIHVPPGDQGGYHHYARTTLTAKGRRLAYGEDGKR